MFNSNTFRGLVLTLVGALTLHANPDSHDERLRNLELRLAALEQENSVLKTQLGQTPAAAPALVPQGRESKLALGGFLHLQGEAGDAPDARFPAGDRFLVRRARLGVKGSFVENVDFVLQADLGHNGLGATTNYRAQMTDAFLVWNKYSFANVTLGQFKVPYGYEQLLSDLKLVTVERSLPNDLLTLPRQVGAMVSGAVLSKRLTYAIAIGNGNGANTSVNDNEQFDVIGRVAGTLFTQGSVKLTAGVNGYTSYDTGAFTGYRTGRGADLQFYADRFEFNAEYLRTEFDRDVGADYEADGWSLLAAYTLVPSRWQVAYRFESYDPHTGVGGDDTTLQTVGLNFFLKGDDLKLSLNYLLGDLPTQSNQGRIVGRAQLVF